ncbi:MAG: YtxH domain-containing protein [Armatimonadetes bacterium]|nr:YtxH domain-containing protein [Armatimonadota bacterium]
MARTREFILGVVAGSAIGAVVALVYAPRAGEQTREMLKGKAEEAKAKATQLADQARERADEVAGEVRTRAASTAEVVKSRAEQVGAGARDVIQRGRSLVEGQMHAVQAAADAYRQAAQETRRTLEREVQEDVEERVATAPAEGGKAA